MKKEKKTVSKTGIAIVVFAFILIVSGYIFMTRNGSEGIEGTYEKIPGVEARYSKDKVEILEMFDFMCPHCYELHKTGIMRRLKEKYGERIEIRYIALHFIEDRYVPYNVAILPILAYEYARDNGREEEMRDAIFEAYHKERLDITDIEVLRGLVDSVGLDTADFAAKLLAYQDRVKNNDDFAFKKYRLNMVPMVIVAGNLNIPYPDYTTFENMSKIIDSILSSTSRLA